MFYEFDGVRFHAALAAVATRARKSMREISRQTGVGASTITRFKLPGRAPEVAAVLALSRWASLNPMDYLVDKRPREGAK